MPEVNRFTGQVIRRMGEKIELREFHEPHAHTLNGVQKLITVLELAFVFWLLTLSIKAIISNVQHLMHVL